MSLLNTLNRYRGRHLALAALLLVAAALLVLVTTPLALATVLGDRAVTALNDAAYRVPAGPEPTCLRRQSPFTPSAEEGHTR